MKETTTKTGRSKDNQKREINIIPILMELLKKVWIIALVGIVCGAAFFLYAKIFVKPTYMCGFTAYVNNQQNQNNKDILTNSDLAASQHLTKTYNYIVKSNSVLEAALKEADSDLSTGALRKMIVTEIQEETEIISVYVVSQSPQEAYKLASALAAVTPTHMANIIEGSSMKIVDYPEYTEQRFKPNYFQYGMVGFLIGCVIAAVIILILYIKDDTVKDESELSDYFSLPILGIIPDANLSERDASKYYSNSYSYEYSSHDKGKE